MSKAKKEVRVIWKKADTVEMVTALGYPADFLGYVHLGYVTHGKSKTAKREFRYVIADNPPMYKGLPSAKVWVTQTNQWENIKFESGLWPKCLTDAKLSIAEYVKTDKTPVEPKPLPKSVDEVPDDEDDDDGIAAFENQQAIRQRLEARVRPLMAERAATSLMSKEHEPLIIRKFTNKGFPLYVSLICGANLDDLDVVVMRFMKDNKKRIKDDSIQTKRNLCGELTEALVEHYGDKTEGVAVLWYVDKMWVSSLYGDMMNHAPCKLELFTLLSIMPHI